MLNEILKGYETNIIEIAGKANYFNTDPYESLTLQEAKEELGFQKDWKHVLMVGLFSVGKNQSEIFDVARLLEKYKIKFHFVGNQAMNFEDYWKPLMDFKPKNCVVWGERDDTDMFYKACDLFYFSSNLSNCNSIFD